MLVAVEVGKCFSNRVTIYYLFNVIMQTLHISRLILVCVDILHLVDIDMLRCVFPSHRKSALSLLKN